MPYLRGSLSRLAPAVLTLTLLAGCLADKNLNHSAGVQPASPIATSVTYPVHAPGGDKISAETLDPDVKATLLAVKALLDGHKGMALEETLAVRGPTEFPNVMGSLADFRVVRVAMSPSPVNRQNPNAKITTGLMRLQDAVGRRLDIGFAAKSRRNETRLDLERVETILVSPVHPQSEAFILPESQINSQLVTAFDSYQSLYRQVQSRALDQAAIQRLPAGPEKYLMVVFMKDALLQDAGLEVHLSAQRGGLAGATDESYYKLFDGGWTVAFVRTEVDSAAVARTVAQGRL